MMTYIEFSQDGAGLALIKDSSEIGFYTEDVMTCAVYGFFGGNGILVVHDSGQLALQSFRTQIELIGPVHRVIYAQNKSQSWLRQNKEHQKRRNRLLNIINFKKNVEKIDIPNGKIFLTNEGVDFNGTKDKITPIPDRDRRLMINKLNNYFSPKNSQSLPIDIQYVNGKYTKNPDILLSLEKMKLRADHELKKNDGDYLEVLKEASALGVIETPNH